MNHNSYSDSGRMPSPYDRQLAALDGLPGVIHTKPSTVRVVPALAVGGSQMFVVQTFRHELGDTVFLELVDGDGATRIVLPPKVTSAIARQRDALVRTSRSRAATEVARDRKARGLKPGFMKKKGTN